jgi:hypothetical protein
MRAWPEKVVMDAGSLKFGGDCSHDDIDRPLCLFGEIRVGSASVANVTVAAGISMSAAPADYGA